MLAGKTPAATVIFPGGGVDLVRPVYGQNAVSGFYNERVAQAVKALSDATQEREIAAIASGIRTLSSDLDLSQRQTLLRSVIDAFSRKGLDSPPLKAFVPEAIAPMAELTLEQARGLGVSLFDGISDRAPSSERVRVVNWATDVVIKGPQASADDQPRDWFQEADTYLTLFARDLNAEDLRDAIAKLSAAAAQQPDSARTVYLARLAADLSGKAVDARLVKVSLDQSMAEATKFGRWGDLGYTASKSAADFTVEQRSSVIRALVSALEQPPKPGTSVYSWQLDQIGDGLQALLLASPQKDARPIVERLVQDLASVADPLQLQELARTLRALDKIPVPANTVDDVLSRVLERLGGESDVKRAAALQGAVEALAARVDPAIATRSERAARTLLAWSAGGITSEAAAAALAAALPRTSALAAVSAAVEYLKYPTTVEKASDVLLDAIAHRVPGAPARPWGLTPSSNGSRATTRGLTFSARPPARVPRTIRLRARRTVLQRLRLRARRDRGQRILARRDRADRSVARVGRQPRICPPSTSRRPR